MNAFLFAMAEIIITLLKLIELHLENALNIMWAFTTKTDQKWNVRVFLLIKSEETHLI